MKITVVTMWYNEAFLAPFFLNHYNYADKIYLLLDADTNDETKEICKQYSNIEIEEFVFPDMMDDLLKAKKIGEVVSSQDCDWVFAVDADEFIFPADNKNAADVLSRQKANLLYAQIWQIYRHRTDKDLDSSKPAIYQRRHGDPNITQGINRLYNKPIIVKPEVEIKWLPGCHSYVRNEKIKISKDKFLGAHWAMADVEMAIERRIKGRKERQSKINIQKRFTIQHHVITEEAIRKECEEHLDDPQLF
jgi:hypothetical protein